MLPPSLTTVRPANIAKTVLLDPTPQLHRPAGANTADPQSLLRVSVGDGLPLAAILACTGDASTGAADSTRMPRPFRPRSNSAQCVPVMAWSSAGLRPTSVICSWVLARCLLRWSRLNGRIAAARG